jgi:hypothetical protein
MTTVTAKTRVARQSHSRCTASRISVNERSMPRSKRLKGEQIPQIPGRQLAPIGMKGRQRLAAWGLGTGLQWGGRMNPIAMSRTVRALVGARAPIVVTRSLEQRGRRGQGVPEPLPARRPELAVAVRLPPATHGHSDNRAGSYKKHISQSDIIRVTVRLMFSLKSNALERGRCRAELGTSFWLPWLLHVAAAAGPPGGSPGWRP